MKDYRTMTNEEINERIETLEGYKWQIEIGTDFMTKEDWAKYNAYDREIRELYKELRGR